MDYTNLMRHSTLLNGYLDWPSLAQVFRVEKYHLVHSVWKE